MATAGFFFLPLLDDSTSIRTLTESLERLAGLLGPTYEVAREIGAGGMAVVYLARDAKHDRPVAIKVLRAELSASLASERFLREIGIAARLQHPNILPLLDSGAAGGQLYFVMPFVEGESLRDRIDKGPIPVGDAVRYVREVADALAHAHAQDVVHRDIKPDNVMLSGRHALVTDFGVARALSAATAQHTLTSVGMALGTPLYMAPEQAAADPNVDHRADIYSLGVMAYELLGGRRPFTGQTAQQIIAAHMTKTPERLSAYAADLPLGLEDIVMRCIARDPDARFQSADDLRAALEDIEVAATRAMPVRRAPRMRPALYALGATAVVVVALGVVLQRAGWAGYIALGGSPAPMTILRTTQFTSDEGLELSPDLSPDGRFVAFAAGTSAHMRIFVRAVDGSTAISLSSDSATEDAQPRWSPDGKQVLYLSHGALRLAPAFGGESRVVVPSSSDTVSTATWSPDGQRIAFVRGDSLYVSGISGDSVRFVARKGELHSCVWRPAGVDVACVSGNKMYATPGATFGNLAPSALVVINTSDGAMRTLATQTTVNQSPMYSADGGKLYFVSDRQGTRDVYVVDASTRDAGSAATRVTTGLGAHSIARSANGDRLVYSVYVDRANVWSLALRDGEVARAAQMEPVTHGNQVIEAMRVTRDGKWLVYDSNLRGHAQIYRMALPAGQPERLTDGNDENFRGDLSPDGKELAFHSWRTGTRDIYVQVLGSTTVTAVTATRAQEAGPEWSPDGQALSFADISGAHDVQVVRRVNGKWGTPVHIAVGGPTTADWSADGRSLLFVSEGTIVIASADGHGKRTIYAPRSGTADAVPEEALWRSDNRAVYFKSHDAMGRAAFWLLPVSGGTAVLVARLDDPSRVSGRSDFAVSGNRLYFAIQDRQSDVWLADIAHK